MLPLACRMDRVRRSSAKFDLLSLHDLKHVQSDLQETEWSLNNKNCLLLCHTVKFTFPTISDNVQA